MRSRDHLHLRTGLGTNSIKETLVALFGTDYHFRTVGKDIHIDPGLGSPPSIWTRLEC